MTILNSPILAWDMKHIQLCEMWAGGTTAKGITGNTAFDDNIAAIDN
ncbi:unnamed protein product, partial [marine sediment metagenome]